MAAATAAAGTWNCPTMTVVKALLQGPETMEGSRRRRELVGALHAAGARLLAGTDSGIDVTVPESRSTTSCWSWWRPASTRSRPCAPPPPRRRSSWGSGRDWDRLRGRPRGILILVDGDPRDDVAVLRHPRAVMLRGAWLERP